MFKKTLAILIAISTIISCTGCQNTYDFTALGADDAYSQICGIMSNPTGYEGDTIKVSGELYTYTTVTGENGVAIIIKDEHGCCSKGIQFVLSDTSSLANLVDGDEIIVEGKFELYTANELLYCKLVDAKLEVLAKGM